MAAAIPLALLLLVAADPAASQAGAGVPGGGPSVLALNDIPPAYGYTGYRAETVRRHTGLLHLPGTLAATEPLTAGDGAGGGFGLVRDRRTGYLTATLRVAAASTWLADPGDADRWVANWAAWLATLGHLPHVRWVSVTVATAPDPGATLTGQVAAALDTTAPRAAIVILDQVVAAAPAAATHGTPGSASPSTPPAPPPAPATWARRSPT